MDKKVLAGVGILAVGGIAFFMMSRSSAGPSMPGAGGGGGAPPPEAKKEGYEAPVFNINFPEPNFPSVPDPMNMYNQFLANTETKKSSSKPRGWGAYRPQSRKDPSIAQPKVTKKEYAKAFIKAPTIVKFESKLGMNLPGGL